MVGVEVEVIERLWEHQVWCVLGVGGVVGWGGGAMGHLDLLIDHMIYHK